MTTPMEIMMITIIMLIMMTSIIMITISPR